MNRETYYLISQTEIDKIDSLIGALNLAISEILEGRPIMDRRAERTCAQADFDEQVGPNLHQGELF